MTVMYAHHRAPLAGNQPGRAATGRARITRTCVLLNSNSIRRGRGLDLASHKSDGRFTPDIDTMIIHAGMHVSQRLRCREQMCTKPCIDAKQACCFVPREVRLCYYCTVRVANTTEGYTGITFLYISALQIAYLFSCCRTNKCCVDQHRRRVQGSSSTSVAVRHAFQRKCNTPKIH